MQMSIPRVFSVSGAYVNRPEIFAFSDFILQAKQGKISIKSNERVFRRFSPIEDVIGLSSILASRPDPIVYETGGELIELLELAELVAQASSPRVTVSHNLNESKPQNHYHSDDLSWQANLKDHNLEQESVQSQISRFSTAIG